MKKVSSLDLWGYLTPKQVKKWLRNTLVKNTLWVTIGEFIAKAFLSILTIVIIRRLGVEKFGQFSFAFSFATLFTFLPDFGFQNLLVRSIAKGKLSPGTYIRHITYVKLVLSLITCIITIGLGFFFVSPASLVGVIALASLYVIFQSFSNLFFAYFNGLEKMEFNAIGRIYQTGLLFIAGIISYALGASIYGFGIGYVVASFMHALTIGIIVFQKTSIQKFKIDPDFIKILLFEAWPFVAAIAFNTIYINLDTTFLSIFRNYAEVGLYQAAYKILFAFQSINLIHSVLFPRFSALARANRPKEYKALMYKVMVLSGLLLIPTGIVLSSLSSYILKILYGTSYTKGGFALFLLL